MAEEQTPEALAAAQEAEKQAAAALQDAEPVTLADLKTLQQEYRDSVNMLREELANARKAQIVRQPEDATPLSPEDALAARLAEVQDYPFYCPGCGALYRYERQCVGRSVESPHPPIEVVTTDELKAGDPSKHTAAPDTTNPPLSIGRIAA